MLSLNYIIAALFVFFGGILILAKKSGDKPLSLLTFFLTASMVRSITDAQLVWAVELIFILFIASYKKSHLKDSMWYFAFLGLAFFSLFYSGNPLRGIPGIVMYIFPLFFYALTTSAIKSTDDANILFDNISKASWVLLALCAISISISKGIVFSYYGMGICTIPAFLFFKTKKKQYIIHFLISLLPALVTIKRTPLLGIAGAMLMFSVLMYKWKALIPSILAISLGVILFFSIPGFREKTFHGTNVTTIQDLSRGSVEDVNMNGRLVFWSIVLEKYHKKAPVLGVGMGTVKAFLQSDQNSYKHVFSLMHNDWLLVLCEQGIIGVLLLLLFMLSILRKCIKYSSRRYPKELRLMSASCAGSVVSTMIHMFFENCMNSLIFSTTFVFYAILIIYIREYLKKSKSVEAQL